MFYIYLKKERNLHKNTQANLHIKQYTQLIKKMLIKHYKTMKTLRNIKVELSLFFKSFKHFLIIICKHSKALKYLNENKINFNDRGGFAICDFC